jgi:hypothetical protein
MTTSLQSTVMARNAITLLLKKEISIRFDQNLPQGENWPTEDRIRQKKRIRENIEEDRTQKKSEVTPLVYVVSSLFVVMKCYSYSKIVLQLIVVLPGEYPINRLI